MSENGVSYVFWTTMFFYRGGEPARLNTGKTEQQGLELME